MKVLIIGGGISPERDISLKSSRVIYEAAISAGHICEFYDWDGSVDWLNSNAKQFDVVLPVLHGKGGEDGGIQKILESLRVSYLGSDSESSQLCFDKVKTRDILQKHGINIASGKYVTLKEYISHSLFNKPHVLKPNGGGSSIDTFIYSDTPQQEMSIIEEVFSVHKKMLLEEYIEGNEITVPVLDGKDLPVTEIIPPEGGTFDLENKYNGQSQELIPPKNINIDIQNKAKLIASDVHEIMGCKHLSRTDMIVREDKIYVLEVNTMPGMTDQSLFPKSALYAGMSMLEFVDYLIKITIEN